MATNDATTYQNFTTHSGAVTSVHGFDAAGNTPPQIHYSTAHSGNIGTESQIAFSGTGGHTHEGTSSKAVAWSSISSRPTTTSAFTNNSGYITGYCSYCSYCSPANCNYNCICYNCSNCGGC